MIESSQKEKEYFAKELLTEINDAELTVLRKILAQLNKNVEQLKENV